MDDVGTAFQLSYDNREFFWKMLPMLPSDVDTVNGVVTDCVTAVTISATAAQQPCPLRPTGHPKRGQHTPTAIAQDPMLHELSSAAANFHAKHGVPISGVHLQDSQPRDDWQLVKSKFLILSSQYSIGGRVGVDPFTDGKPGRLGNSQCE